MTTVINNKKRSRLTSWLPFVFPLMVYVIWFYSQGLSEALANFIAQVSIAVTMAFGSFVAGGTALGGGAVAFPVMTKALGIAPATAKVFSLAIQSFGMTAAALTIIFGHIRYYKNVIFLAIVGAVPGVIISLIFVAELVPRLATKSIFSVLLLFFAITLVRMHANESPLPQAKGWPKKYLITLVGFVGGITSGLIGSGADIFVFALLVLFYRKDLKLATATSVIIMAVTSVVGSLCNLWYLEAFNSQIDNYVLAAIPVVVVGAPLGAYACSKVQPQVLVSFLLFLIGIEVFFTGIEWMTFVEDNGFIPAKLFYFS
jgi:uncharacterized membrane protein YfcA